MTLTRITAYEAKGVRLVPLEIPAPKGGNALGSVEHAWNQKVRRWHRLGGVM